MLDMQTFPQFSTVFEYRESACDRSETKLRIRVTWIISRSTSENFRFKDKLANTNMIPLLRGFTVDNLVEMIKLHESSIA